MLPVYITSWGAHLPGEPVDNDHIEEVLGLVNGKTSSAKRRILRSNGIQTRHYALDSDGQTTMLNEEIAVKAITQALERRGLPLADLEMLAVGTTQGDLAIPGFASMVHGRLGHVPMDILSAGGVCCSSMAAFKSAWNSLRLGEHSNAAVCGSEMVSRMLKASRFVNGGPVGVQPDSAQKSVRGSYKDFDADFLRWMLSDGAGAILLENKPNPNGFSLRVNWAKLVSHANEFETCMYIGVEDKSNPVAGGTWLDFPTFSAADAANITKIRQDVRILPQIVKLGVEEYLRLIQAGRIVPDKIDHILCHYSSHFFKGEIVKLLEQAGIHIPEEKWFTNLYTKGNTGAASIFIMLEEAMTSGRVKLGDQVLLMVPESGRFTVSFAHLTCVDASDPVAEADQPITLRGPKRRSTFSATSHTEMPEVNVEQALQDSPLGDRFMESDDEILRWLTVELALVWADFDRMLRQVPLIKRMNDGTITLEDYKRLLVNLRQQVVDGARWIARAASNVSAKLFPYRSMFITHAGDEHRDFQILERNFVALGGTLEEIQNTEKNIGSEALSAFMFHRAGQPDPLDMLGSMFIIEGLGASRARQWAAKLKSVLKLEDEALTFLTYHGSNDDNHFDKLREVVSSGLITREIGKQIVKTAKVTARLYALQLEEIDNH